MARQRLRPRELVRQTRIPYRRDAAHQQGPLAWFTPWARPTTLSASHLGGEEAAPRRALPRIAHGWASSFFITSSRRFKEFVHSKNRD